VKDTDYRLATDIYNKRTLIMATTATTPSELILAIDTTIRTKVTPNSITPDTHSGLLDNIVEVLSADTYTNAASYDVSASTINFTTSNTGVTYSVSGITDTNIYTTGGTYVASASTITFGDNNGGDYAVSGIVSATTGFTGTGSFTTLTIVNGIITNAV